MLDLIGTGAQVFVSGSQVPKDFARHRLEGDSPGFAGFKTGSSFFANSLLSIPGAVTVGIGVAALSPIARGIGGYNAKVSRMGVPFSQRFEHNEMTSRLQSYGLSRIGAMGGLGNEASAMYGRYGR